MYGLERTLNFIRGDSVDHPPFHPILMRWASRYADIRYSEFCLDHRKKCEANIQCAKDFDIDWVTVLSDAYVEATAFGIQVEYPDDDLPLDRGGHLPDLETAIKLKPYRIAEHSRTMNRVSEIKDYKQRVGDKCFIVGWVEGPVAEFADLRGVSNAAMDLLDDPGKVGKVMDIILESALDFITFQIEAGAHCVGIGDAFCSQISPKLYRHFALGREKRMVEHIHNLGALAKLHICGNTSNILPEMIKTDADIIDVDHLVLNMSEYAGLLSPHQVFSGNADPVSLIQDGDSKSIEQHVQLCHEQTRGRCIVSAGCEITPGTSIKNMQSFHDAAIHLKPILH